MEEIERKAARLLVRSPDDRVLLLRLEPSFRSPFWVTPGGGLHEGETYEQAALRELAEEVGRVDLALGPCIWSRRVDFTWEEWSVHQEERTFLVDVPEVFDAVVLHPDEEPIVGADWFSIERLSSLIEVVYPEGLHDLVEALRLDGPPKKPLSLPAS